MKQYQGAVFFVDILGVSALTRGEVKLCESDFVSHGLRSKKNPTDHKFCARLLIKFRRILIDIQKDYEDVKVAQLSDCAFFWSANSIELVDAARNYMWKSVKKGILSRGGIAYGNIVEPDKVKMSIGKFILGEAVTKAVDMERSGKGCRVFSDEDLPAKILDNKYFRFDPFVELRNPTDCSVTDEFRWYLFPDKIKFHDRLKNCDEQIVVTLMELVSLLRFSPLFRWNCSSKLGEIHLAASIETISSCVDLFKKDLNYKCLSEKLIGSFNHNPNVKDRFFASTKREIHKAFANKKLNKKIMPTQ